MSPGRVVAVLFYLQKHEIKNILSSSNWLPFHGEHAGHHFSLLPQTGDDHAVHDQDVQNPFRDW